VTLLRDAIVSIMHDAILLHEAIKWRSCGSILGDAIVCQYCMTLFFVQLLRDAILRAITACRYYSCNYCVTLFFAPLLRLYIFRAASAWRHYVTLFCVGIAWWYSLCHYRASDWWRGCVCTWSVVCTLVSIKHARTLASIKHAQTQSVPHSREY